MSRAAGNRVVAIAFVVGAVPAAILAPGAAAAGRSGAPEALAFIPQSPSAATGQQDPTEPSPEAQTPPADAQAPDSARPAEGQVATVEAPGAPDAPVMPSIVNEVVATLGDVYNDVFFWGQSATVTGTLHDNAFLFGQVIDVDQGRVEGDLFVFAATTTLNGEIDSDVYAFTSNMRVAEGTTIHGNLICMCGGLQVEGVIAGKIWGGGGLTRIDGDVGGVDIETGDLRIGATARIRGDLAYEGNEEAEIADGARIDGQIRWNPTTDEDDTEDEPAAPSPWISGWSIVWTVWRYLSGLIVGLAFLMLGGSTARRPAESLREQPAWGLGYGFVVAVVVPVACAIAMVMIVSLPLGVITLVLFGVAVFLARLVTAQFFGDWILRLVGLKDASAYAALATGLAALLMARAIPYVGFLVGLFAVVLGLGGIYLAARAGKAGPADAAVGASRSEAS